MGRLAREPEPTLAAAKQDAALVKLKLQEDAGIDVVSEGGARHDRDLRFFQREESRGIDVVVVRPFLRLRPSIP